MKSDHGKLQKTNCARIGGQCAADEAIVVDQAAYDRKRWWGHLGGRKYIRQLEKLLVALRRTHVQPNRTMYYVDIVTLLLGFLTSKIRRLRLLDLCSQGPGVRQHLREDRICRSTLSEGPKLFDPQSWMPLIRELYQALSRKPGVAPEFKEPYEKLVAFDRSYFHVPTKVFWALRQKGRNQVESRQVHLNLYDCVSNGKPQGMSISGEDGLLEAQAVFEDVELGLVYIKD
ncbi:MAG: hypothetical protein HKL96_09375 [Phycisphaerales bacterium]|nr:hypothetical protein [Phycisphaerales bacterium]